MMTPVIGSSEMRNGWVVGGATADPVFVVLSQRNISDAVCVGHYEGAHSRIAGTNTPFMAAEWEKAHMSYKVSCRHWMIQSLRRRWARWCRFISFSFQIFPFSNIFVGQYCVT